MSERHKIRSYRDLAVWQLGMVIAVKVYEVTKSVPTDERFGLTRQLHRAVAETATFVELAARLNYGNVDELRKIFEMTAEERRMHRTLQKSLRRRLPPL